MPTPTGTTKIKVGSTGNAPELVDRIPIARAAAPGGRRHLVLSLGADSDTDLPLPAIEAGDRLRIFVELAVTTDYADPKAPGLIGSAYGYTPRIEATLLAAADAKATAPAPGRAKQIGPAWVGECSHEHHHRVITLGDYGVDADELDWASPYFLNVTLAAAHPSAKRSNKLLVGQNEPTPIVGTDMAGIRVVRLRPGEQNAVRPQVIRRPLVPGIPVSQRELERKLWVNVYSFKLEDLAKGEQLLVRARLNTDASRLGYPCRVSTRLLLTDDPRQVEPSGEGRLVATWKGHISKPNGFNCLPADGIRSTLKFGVLEARRNARNPLYVNLAAVSSEPFGGAKAGQRLPIKAGSLLEVTRYPPTMNG